VTESGQAARAAKQATQTIPIVMAVGSDPVAAGLVASLARPGGNVTGLALQLSGLSGKRLELLKEVAPPDHSGGRPLECDEPRPCGLFGGDRGHRESRRAQLSTDRHTNPRLNRRYVEQVAPH
jgi:hypothetical protein